jgi:competence protein ComEC
VRILIALAAGIVAGYFISDVSGAKPLISFINKFSPYILGALFLLLIAMQRRLQHHSAKWHYGVVFSLTLFILGTSITTHNLSAVCLPLPQSEQTYTIRLIDNATNKGNSLLFHAKILSKRDGNKDSIFAPQPLILFYVKNDTTSASLHMNDEVAVRTQPYMPAAKGGITTRFSYRKYLYRNGVSATCYADSAMWRLRGHKEGLSLLQRAGQCRSRVLDYYRQLGFGGDNLAVLSALTLGYRESLDKELQESYSTAGVSHALAISGMHIGFVCALILFLFQLMRWNTPTANMLKAIVAISILTAYIFIIGMPVSAVRAGIMFALYMITAIYRQNDKLPLNVLAATATLMLLFRPLWLFDTGFQLSVTAVASIVILYPRMEGLYTPKWRIVRAVWQMFCVTIVAQIGTAPLTAYYFFRLPLYFLLTNPVVVLLVTAIIYGTMAMLLIFPLPWLQTAAATTIDSLLSTLNGFVGLAGTLPHATFNNLYLRPFEVLIVYTMLTAAIMFIRHRKARPLQLFLLSVTALTISQFQFRTTHMPHNGIMMYSCNGVPVVHCTATDGHSWAVVPDSARTIRRSSMAELCAMQQLQEVEFVKSGYRGKSLRIANQVLSYHGCKVAIVNDGRWQKSGNRSVNVDYLYICRGYRGNIEKTLQRLKANCVVLDDRLSEATERRIYAKCMQRGVECRKISQKGYISIML